MTAVYSVIANVVLIFFLFGILFGGLNPAIIIVFLAYLAIGAIFGYVKKKLSKFFSLLFVSPGLLLCTILEIGCSLEQNSLFGGWILFGIIILISVEIGIWAGKLFRFLEKKYKL